MDEELRLTYINEGQADLVARVFGQLAEGTQTSVNMLQQIRVALVRQGMSGGTVMFFELEECLEKAGFVPDAIKNIVKALAFRFDEMEPLDTAMLEKFEMELVSQELHRQVQAQDNDC